MFVGHYSVSFAARRVSTDVPLWIWFVAVQWLDLFFMVFVLAGVEKMRIVPGFTESNSLDLYSMPYSHGLLGAAVLSVVFAVLVVAFCSAARRPGTFLLLALAVFSHWILDFVVHTPDLALVGTQKVGLGLWNHLAIELPLELILVALFAWLYAHGADPIRRRRTWILVGLMVVLQVYSTWGPTPPSTTQFAITGLTAYALFILGAYWVERTPQKAP